jgi:hypothetical protein
MVAMLIGCLALVSLPDRIDILMVLRLGLKPCSLNMERISLCFIILKFPLDVYILDKIAGVTREKSKAGRILFVQLVVSHSSRQCNVNTEMNELHLTHQLPSAYFATTILPQLYSAFKFKNLNADTCVFNSAVGIVY